MTVVTAVVNDNMSDWLYSPFDEMVTFSIFWRDVIIIILKALQLQRSFGLLNEFFPFGPVSDAVPPVCYFHICYVTFYIIISPIFRSS